MTFDRPAFEAAVLSRSPLSPDKFDAMLGGSVDSTNKRLAWHIMQMTPKDQYAVWLTVARVKKAFPSAILERVI